jgi:outer membrane beta-barrel protein
MTEAKVVPMGTSMKGSIFKKLLCGVVAAAAVLTASEKPAEAQEILLTGPLAGAPAVRKLRLYREKRIEISPLASFTLLDEYQRTILFGARLNYNITDWLAIGVYGAYGALKIETGLSDEIQKVNEGRSCRDPNTGQPSDLTNPNCRLTAVNMGQEFKEQLGTLDWIVAPQLTVVPFRGKLALFQSIYVDTDLYFFAGPAFIGVKERKDCDADCQRIETFDRQSRVAIAPTFGLGFSFYVNKWNAIGFEYRGLPFSRNTGGFDVAGADPNKEFPDNKINGDDRQFKFNQVLTVSYNFYFPQDFRVSE